MDIHVQLEERVPNIDDTHRHNGNVLLDHLFGATIHSFPVGEDEDAADASLDAMAGNLRAEGRTPYIIGLAASTPPLGARLRGRRDGTRRTMRRHPPL
jgi:1-aminocyclopropane-1-carboxylate deaminase/D-cysteine desulfhydrase-like pyridoxal-dependent ACC family enzyme